MTKNQTRCYEFGPFRLDGARGQLLRDGQPVAVPPKAYDILVALIENRERLVERDELVQRVWPDVVVEEANLTQNVFTIRKLLGDEQSAPRYIETVPRRGYRFIAPVSIVEDATKASRIRVLLSAKQAAPLVVVLILVAWFVARATWVGNGVQPPAASSGPIRLAVLPFVNLSDDPSQEYFSDGLTEELISQLGHVRPQRFGVIARTSVMRYKNARRRVDEIGRELDARFIVEGSVRRLGEQLRVTARLVNAIDQTDLWTETYDRTFSDIFAIQQDIALRVSQSLARELFSTERQMAVAQVRATSPAAYEAYLLGLFHWNRMTEDGVRKSIEYFERAIQADPGYAHAYSRLAMSYNLLASGNFANDRDSYRRAKAAALRALEIDESLAAAHTALGFVKWRFDWDWSGARRDFGRALELDANDPSVHHAFGLYLYSLAQFDGAIAEMRKVQELDPLQTLAKWNLGRILLTMRRRDEAMIEFRRALEIEPGSAWPHMGLGLGYLEQGLKTEALTEIETARSLSRNALPMVSMLAYAHARLGNTTATQELIQELIGVKRDIPAYHVAFVYHALGDTDAALAWLEKAYTSRDDTIVYLKVDPMFETLRADPAVQSLIRRIGIPP